MGNASASASSWQMLVPCRRRTTGRAWRIAPWQRVQAALCCASGRDPWEASAARGAPSARGPPHWTVARAGRAPRSRGGAETWRRRHSLLGDRRARPRRGHAEQLVCPGRRAGPPVVSDAITAAWAKRVRHSSQLCSVSSRSTVVLRPGRPSRRTSPRAHGARASARSPRRWTARRDEQRRRVRRQRRWRGVETKARDPALLLQGAGAADPLVRGASRRCRAREQATVEGDVLVLRDDARLLPIALRGATESASAPARETSNGNLGPGSSRSRATPAPHRSRCSATATERSGGRQCTPAASAQSPDVQASAGTPTRARDRSGQRVPEARLAGDSKLEPARRASPLADAGCSTTIVLLIA